MFLINDLILEVAVVLVSIFVFFFSKLAFINNRILNSTISEIKKVNIVYLAIFFGFFLSLDYWILGKSSLLNLYDEGDSKFPLASWISNHDQFQFSHNMLGGIFVEAISFSTRYLNFNIFLLNFFSGFFSYVFLKVVVYSFCLFGCLKLFTKYTNNIALSLLLSIVYLYSHPYIYNTNFSHGIGYAGIPLSIYVCYHLNFRKSKYIVIGYCFFLSTFSSFPHSLMPLLLSLLVYLPLELKRSSEEIKIIFNRFLLFFILIIFFVVLNHFNYIVYVFYNSNDIARVGLVNNYTTGNLLSAFYFINSKFSFGGLWILSIVFLSIYLICKKKYFYLGILFAPIVFSTFANYLSSFHVFSMIRSIRFDLMLFSYPTIIILIFVNEFKNFDSNKLAKNVLLLFFLCILFYAKIFNIAGWLQSNSFRANYIINKEQNSFLIDRKIISKDKYFESNFRSAMIPSKANPGAFFWFNNISSLDGHSNFFYKKFVKAYSEAVKFEISHNEFLITERHKIKFRNFSVEGEQSLTKFIDIDFLKKNAVKYIFSKIPLKQDVLKLVLEPQYKEKYSNFYDVQLENFLRNFRDAEFYIYELNGSEEIFSFEQKNNLIIKKPCKISYSQILKNSYGWTINLNSCQKKNIENFNLVISLPNVNKIKLMGQNKNLIKEYIEKEKLSFNVPGSAIKDNDTIFVKPYYK